MSNNPDQELKATTIRILAGLEENIEDIRDTLTTEIKEHKTNQAKMKMH